MANIDHELLKKLAFDPQVSTRQAFERLGFNNYATFDYQLKKDPEALKIWQQGRDAAAGTRSAPSETPAKSAQAPPRPVRKAKKKSVTKTNQPTNQPTATGMPTVVLTKICCAN